MVGAIGFKLCGDGGVVQNSVLVLLAVIFSLFKALFAMNRRQHPMAVNRRAIRPFGVQL